jgi:PPOX class probable F420-dependent enzyme
MSDIEFTGDLGRRAQERLESEQIAWLTTVRPNGIPEPNPIWFLWDGTSVVLRSQDNLKVRNIRANPHVALNFNSDGGGDVVVLRGVARIGTEAEFDAIRDDYFHKYAEGIKSLGTTPERMASSYSVVIVIEPTKLRGF